MAYALAISQHFIARIAILRLARASIMRLPASTDTLRRYVAGWVERFRQMDVDGADDEVVMVMASLLDLVGHRNPRARVLELGEKCGCN